MFSKFRSLSPLAVLVLSACSIFGESSGNSSILHPYRIDVRQGNYLTQDMVAKLRRGQTKDQVRFILGSPLIEDAFHSERWDYVYRFTPGHGETTERHFAVYFENNQLARVSGDVVADTPEAAAADQREAAKRTKMIEIGGAASAQPVAGAKKP